MKDQAAWLKFAEVCRPSFDECGFQAELIRACGGQADLAWAVFYRLGEGSLGWLHARVPALGQATPAALIAAGRADQVRDGLWRMP